MEACNLDGMTKIGRRLKSGEEDPPRLYGAMTKRCNDLLCQSRDRKKIVQQVFLEQTRKEGKSDSVKKTHSSEEIPNSAGLEP